jgi:hypothetical protein
VPAAGTDGIAGVKPRSNASIEILSAGLAGDPEVVTAGWTAADGAAAGAKLHVGGPALAQPVSAMVRPTRMAKRGRGRWRRISAVSRSLRTFDG